NLPRMKIKYDKLTFLLIHCSNSAARPFIWQQPEVSTTADRKILAGPTNGRSRQFPERTALARHSVHGARSFRDSIAIVVDGPHARIRTGSPVYKDNNAHNDRCVIEKLGAR